jgi:hypothetical protein
MTWRSTGILLTVAAVLFAFVWLVERPVRLERLKDADHSALPGFDPELVNTISIKPRGADDIHAARLGGTNDSWQLTKPIPYPAESAAIEALLAGFKVLNWQERITATELKSQPKAHEKFGFNDPLFEISLQSDSDQREILLGETSAAGDQLFMEVVGNPNIYIVSSELLQLLPSDKDQWRDLALLDPAALKYDSIVARSPGKGVIKLDRDPTNQIWLMSKPVAARADNAWVNALLKRLQGVMVQQFVSDDPKADLETYGLQTTPQTPDLDLSFLRGANVAAELQLGAGLTNQPGLVFARRNSPSNIVIIDKAALAPWQSPYTNFMDFHFISTPPGAIEAIQVQGEGSFLVQKEDDGQWLVHGTPSFPADAILMRDWLASFTNIQTQIEETVAADLAAYGLQRPALQYTLLTNGTPSQSNAPVAVLQFGTNKNGRIFEHRPDETFVNFIGAEDFHRLPTAPWQLRDRTIWNFQTNDVVSLTIHQHGDTRKYLRDPEGGWTFDPHYRGLPLVNWPSLEEGIFRLGRLKAVYWSGVGNANWQKFGFPQADFNLSLELKQNGATATNSIAFGGRSPYSYPYASVVLDGKRLIFEFPVDLYENFVERDMTIPAENRHHP